MKYSFKALKNDVIVQKTIEATTESEVLNYLRKNSYIPISITQNKSLLPQFNSLFDTLIMQIYFLIMKINNVRGD